MKGKNTSAQANIFVVILMILMVLVAVVIVWNVVKFSLKKTSGEVSVSKFILKGDVKYSLTSLKDNASVSVYRGAGGGNISGVRIIFEFADKTKKNYENKSVYPNELETKVYFVTNNSLGVANFSSLAKVSVYFIYAENGKDKYGLEIESLGSGRNFFTQSILKCANNNDCDDSNPCTDNICNTGTGICSNDSNTANCNDGNACTVGDLCSNKACMPGSPMNCIDADSCTIDSCSNGNCHHVFDNANPGCVCNSDTQCNDNNICTTDSCNLASHDCVYTNNNIGCNDNNLCTSPDVCLGGTCSETPKCVSPQICDASTGNCYCNSKTCFQLGKECGSWDNGCGTPIPCGTCSNNHGATSCNNGLCNPICSPLDLWGNCDSNNKNGCETDLTTNTNCGSCGNICSGGTSCIGGSCVPDCIPEPLATTCGTRVCGNKINNCGQTVSCGTCAICNPDGQCITCSSNCINSCRTLDTQGAVYNLIANINGPCLTIAKDNIQINGNRFIVNGDIDARKDSDKAYTGLIVNNIIIIGNVYASGASTSGAGFLGGSVTITNSNITGIIDSSGGSPGGGNQAGVGGNIIITNSNVTTLDSHGGSGSNGENGGSITVTYSTVFEPIKTYGGDGEQLCYTGWIGGDGGDIQITDSKIKRGGGIDTHGGVGDTCGSGTGYDGSAGNIILTRVTDL